MGVTLAGAAAGVVGAAFLGDHGSRLETPAEAAAGRIKLTTFDEAATLVAPDASTTHRLFGHLKGPRTAAKAAKGGLITGLIFETKIGGWLEGYWLWVCPRGGSTAPQEFALWILYQGKDFINTGSLVAAGTATSGKLRRGKWNYVKLPKPIGLSIDTLYQLETSWHGGIPVTENRWDTSWKKGVKSGPLFAPPTGPNETDQGPFIIGRNPTKTLTVYGSGSPFFWIDLQFSTVAPAGGSYRLWPSMPVTPNLPKNVGGDDWDTTEQSCGTEFWLSDAHSEYTLDKIWFYSPPENAVTQTPKAALLPSACSIFAIAPGKVAAGTLVPRTMVGVTGPNPAPKDMPDWRKADGSKATAGSGWVYCEYKGIKLPPGKYKTAVYCYGGGTVMSPKYLFFDETRFYFGPVTGGGAAVVPDNIVNGPLTSPSVANASWTFTNAPGAPAGTLVRGNSSYVNNDPATQTGKFLYPSFFDASDNGENRWVDVEVTAVSAK